MSYDQELLRRAGEDPSPDCHECEGEGVNEKGETCEHCGGTGVEPYDEDFDADENLDDVEDTDTEEPVNYDEPPF